MSAAKTTTSPPGVPQQVAEADRRGAARPDRRTVVNRVLLTLIAVVVLTAAFVLPRVYENRFDPKDPAAGVPAPALTAEQEAVFIEQTVTSAAHPGLVVEGRDGFLFLGDAHNANISQAVGRRAYSEAEVNQQIGALRAQQANLASKNIPMAFVVAPAKWSIYDEKLPEWSDGMPKTHIIDQLLAADPGLPIVDVREPLIEAKETADTYSPLNSHWTDYGAAVAWSPISEWLANNAQSVGDVPVPTVEDVETVDYNNEFESLAGITGANPWTKPVYAEPLGDYQLTVDGGEPQTVPGDTTVDIVQMPATTSNPDAANSSRVLVLADSTATVLSPLLAATFAETLMVRHQFDNPAEQPSVPQLVADFDPDLVLYVVTERHLNVPLSDGPVWDGANRFEQSSQSLASWPAQNPDTCSGPASLSAAFTCRVGAGQAVALQVTATSEAPGDVKLQAGEHTVTLHLGSGETTTYAVLPSQIAKNDIVMTAITPGLSAAITGVEIRAVP